MCGVCNQRYEVTYPEGHTPVVEEFRTATAARVAASKVAGATWRQKPKTRAV